MRDATAADRPTAAELEMFRCFNMRECEDGSTVYRRWHHAWACGGVVYMPGTDHPWGVYWGSCHDLESMAWCARLTTAIAVMVRMS